MRSTWTTWVPKPTRFATSATPSPSSLAHRKLTPSAQHGSRLYRWEQSWHLERRIEKEIASEKRQAAKFDYTLVDSVY